VPIDEAMRVSEQLKKSGKVTRGRIGVQIGEVSKEVAESLGLKSAQGAEVSLVEPGGPADKAGIKPGDIILKFNGTPVKRSSDLPRLDGARQQGHVTIWRKGAELTCRSRWPSWMATSRPRAAKARAARPSRPAPTRWA
jgi:serine protease Do